MNSIYFDPQYLKLYLQAANDSIEIFDGNNIYNVSDEQDLVSWKEVVAYTPNGEMVNVPYKEIQWISVNNQKITLDDLATAFEKSKEEEEELEDAASDSGDGGEEEMPPEDEEAGGEEEMPPEDEDEPADEPKKEESVKVGDYVQIINPNHSGFMLKGGVQHINEGIVQIATWDEEQNKMTRKFCELDSVTKLY